MTRAVISRTVSTSCGGHPVVGSASNRYSVHGIPVSVDADVPWLAAGDGELPYAFLGTKVARLIVTQSQVSSGGTSRARWCVTFPLARRGCRATRTSSSCTRTASGSGSSTNAGGIVEVNLLRSHWRAWVLDAPPVRPDECVDAAVLWPLAQLMRSRGVHVVPAMSVSLGQRAALIVSPYELGAELSVMLDAGYRVVGQRWTALREEQDGRVSVIQMPGWVRRVHPKDMGLVNDHVDRVRPNAAVETYHDFMVERPASCQCRSTLATVVVVEPGRRDAGVARDPLPRRCPRGAAADVADRRTSPAPPRGDLPGTGGWARAMRAGAVVATIARHARRDRARAGRLAARLGTTSIAIRDETQAGPGGLMRIGM
jgi:hypothetical protein